MTSAITRTLPIFAAAFAVLYVIAEQQNWALLTYHPRTGEWGWLREAARAPNSPAMYWYGWIGTAWLGATAASLAVLPLTRRGFEPPVWIGWAVPLAVLIMFVYLFRTFFI